MVLDCTDDSHRGFIGKCWYNARIPESVAQCNPGPPPNRAFHGSPTDMGILVPSSPRTTAEDGGEDEFVYRYQYCGKGGLSWSGHIAGIFKQRNSKEQQKHKKIYLSCKSKSGRKMANCRLNTQYRRFQTRSKEPARNLFSKRTYFFQGRQNFKGLEVEKRLFVASWGQNKKKIFDETDRRNNIFISGMEGWG